MVSFKDFHDGEFEGIWIEGATAHVFVKTLQGERFVLTATGVAALAADGFCAGNIILDIESTSAKDLTTRDISDVRRYRPGMEDEHASKSLRLSLIHIFSLSPDSRRPIRQWNTFSR